MAYDDMEIRSDASTSAIPLSAQSPARRLLKRRAKGIVARTTCIHTQLRDLLVCPEVAGEIITSSYQSMAKYTFPSSQVPRHGRSGKPPPSTKSMFSNLSGRKEHIQSLSFIPNVLVKGCGLLAAGGHQAEISILPSPNSSSSSASRPPPWQIKTSIGHSINNSIHISPSPFHPLSIPWLHISNNDAHIYFYELHHPARWGSLEMTDEEDEWSKPTLVPRGKTRLETPVNHCSVSPDGRRMVAVGDTDQVFLFDVNAGGQHTMVDAVEVSTDASFSTSWSRTGLQFAVASQDGLVSIFDVRRPLSPLKRFYTHNHGHPSGAARVVKYSPGSNELLAFSEQRGYVHVVDARTYDYIEEIDLLQTELEECGRPVAVAHHQPQFQQRDLGNDRTRTLALMELERRNRQERHPLPLGSSSNNARPSISRGQQTYSASRSIIARDPNPWDTFGTDDRSANTMPASVGAEEAGGGLSDYNARLTRAYNALRGASEILSPPEREEEEEDGMDWLEEDDLQEEDGDCPFFPSENQGSTARPYSNLARSPWRTSLAQERALPPLTSSFQATFSPPSAASDLRLPPSSSHPSGDNTVSLLLSSLADTPHYHAPDRYRTIEPAEMQYYAATAADRNSVTGLDWDPMGKWLYVGMERVVLEWQVNEEGRRCVPSASVL